MLAAFAAVALAAWQRRTEGSRGAIVVLAASLAATLWTHYYGVLIFLPIAAGEIVRTQKTRRIDFGVWGALAAGACALFLLLPMIRSASQIGSIFWTKVGVVQAFSIYPALVERLSLPAVVVGAIFLATGLPPRERVPGPGLKAYEVAAVLAFVSLPLLAYGLARAVTGALAPRYVLGTVVGLAIAFAFASRGVFGDAIASALLVLLALGLAAVGSELAIANKQRHLRAELNEEHLSRILFGRSGPVVVMDNDLLMQLWHYEPESVSERLFYVADEKAAVELFGWNTTERAFAGLQPFSKRVHLRSYADLMRGEKRFTLIEGIPGYVARMLLADGAELRMMATFRNEWVFDVQLPAEPVSPSRLSALHSKLVGSAGP